MRVAKLEIHVVELAPTMKRSIRWFETRVLLLHAENHRLENSLYCYKLGFWSAVLVAVVMALGIIAELGR